MSNERFRTREEYERRLGYTVGEPDIGFDPTRNYDPEPYEDSGPPGINLSSTSAHDALSSSLSPATSPVLSPAQGYQIGDLSTASQASVPQSTYTMSSSTAYGSNNQAYTSDDSPYRAYSAYGSQSPSAAPSKYPLYAQANDTPLHSYGYQSQSVPGENSSYALASDAPYSTYRTSGGSECGGDNDELPDEPRPPQPPPRTGDRENRDDTGRRRHRDRNRERERRRC